MSILGALPRGERPYMALARSFLPKVVLLIFALSFLFNAFSPVFTGVSSSAKAATPVPSSNTAAGRRRIAGASSGERGLSGVGSGGGAVCHGMIVPTVSVMGKTAVALAFEKDQLDAAIKALELWDKRPSCTVELDVKERAVLLVYGNMDLRTPTEAGKKLREKVASLPSLKKCFAQVQYVSAYLADDPNHQARQQHKWMRGNSMMFYNMIFFELHTGRLMSLGIEHMLWLEPGSEVRREGWLDTVMLEAAKAKGNYWVQGTAFRGKCVPLEDGKCHAVRRVISAVQDRSGTDFGQFGRTHCYNLPREGGALSLFSLSPTALITSRAWKRKEDRRFKSSNVGGLLLRFIGTLLLAKSAEFWSSSGGWGRVTWPALLEVVLDPSFSRPLAYHFPRKAQAEKHRGEARFRSV